MAYLLTRQAGRGTLYALGLWSGVGAFPGCFGWAAGRALVLYGSIVMPIRVFVNSYGEHSAIKIYPIICVGICIICPLWYTLKEYTAGGDPGRSPAVLAGGRGICGGSRWRG